jgi:hypothetical protein
MFQREHTIFIIKSYYSNGNRVENGVWIYSPRLCCIAKFTRLWFRAAGVPIHKYIKTVNIINSQMDIQAVYKRMWDCRALEFEFVTPFKFQS